MNRTEDVCFALMSLSNSKSQNIKEGKSFNLDGDILEHKLNWYKHMPGLITA